MSTTGLRNDSHICFQSGEAYLGLIKTSIVAGVIVLLLVGVFTYVKCARLWRDRNSKSRKAMVKNMLSRREYATVPVSWYFVLLLETATKNLFDMIGIENYFLDYIPIMITSKIITY